MDIELWSDFACPWCALGIYRLDAARAKFEHGDEISVRHRAFELDPRAPARRDETMAEMLVKKYGMRPEQMQAGHRQLTEMGAEVGMEFNFDQVMLGSTFDAHRLTQAARKQGPEVEDALVKRLFAAYFTNGALLSDPATLRQAGAAAGVDEALTTTVLESSAHAEDVRADESAAHERGITGVPHFIINGTWAVPGAQDVDTLVTVLQRAWDRAHA